VAVLGAELQGLHVCGSYAGGDFAPERSDLDLLAVLDSDPTQGLADSLGAVHDAVAADHPRWRDRARYSSAWFRRRLRVLPATALLHWWSAVALGWVAFSGSPLAQEL